ncbi:hypothetical protein SMC1_06575 [Candidatus Cryosericum septentrionale]|uniref:Death-on-curing protein n=2 Tax=Candidatus Cryosericum septentrionale TaxID=2290913 RepID=A0A398DNG9_9BACT|nr:hypothetical protein SMC1_06575 [Candidatus Cryosericum septentrionale]
MTDSSNKGLGALPDFCGDGIVLCTAPDGTMKLDVRLEKETVWLTQPSIAELFQTTVPNISMHLRNIYEEGELSVEATLKDFLTVRQEGTRQVSRNLEYYNLDAIISVGYRVMSRVATQFRIWTTNVLRDRLIKGYLVNEQRLQELNQAIRLVADLASRRDLTG